MPKSLNHHLSIAHAGGAGQFLTDWMGDDGILKSFSCQIRHPNIIGDVNRVKGKVTDKTIRDNEYLVDCEIGVENQAGIITAPGRATVALPSRKIMEI